MSDPKVHNADEFLIYQKIGKYHCFVNERGRTGELKFKTNLSPKYDEVIEKIHRKSE
jgi:hypothetical protein